MCAYEKGVHDEKPSTDMAFNKTQIQDFLAFVAQSAADGMSEQRGYGNLNDFLGDCFEV
jgi:hypothetical protein